MPSEAFRRHFQHRNFKEKELKPSFPRKTENQKKPKIRHSRAGGNPIRPVSVFFFFFEFQVTSKPPFPQKQKIKNWNFVIPAKAGIQKPKAARIYQKWLKLKKPDSRRKQESGVSGLEKPFFPISFRTDRPRFPPAREWRYFSFLFLIFLFLQEWRYSGLTKIRTRRRSRRQYK